jgi:hypothetical protein
MATDAYGKKIKISSRGNLDNFGDKRNTWKKGVSGNPHGRPPKEQCIPVQLQQIGGRPLTALMVKDLKREFPGENFEGMNYLQAVMFRVYRRALNGEQAALDFFAERTEGKVTENVNIRQESQTQAVDLTDLPMEKIKELRGILRDVKNKQDATPE